MGYWASLGTLIDSGMIYHPKGRKLLNRLSIFVISCLLLFFGSAMVYQRYLLNTDGINVYTPATNVSTERCVFIFKCHHFDVKLLDKQNQETIIKIDTSLTTSSIREGETVEIAYLPSHPNITEYKKVETYFGILSVLISLFLFWRFVGDPVSILKEFLDYCIKHDSSMRRGISPFLAPLFRFPSKGVSRMIYCLSLILIGLFGFLISLSYNNKFTLFWSPFVLFIGLYCIDLGRLERAKNIFLYIFVWLYLVTIYIESIRYITWN